jgi:hypothetical protein
MAEKPRTNHRVIQAHGLLENKNLIVVTVTAVAYYVEDIDGIATLPCLTSRASWRCALLLAATLEETKGVELTLEENNKSMLLRYRGIK